MSSSSSDNGSQSAIIYKTVLKARKSLANKKNYAKKKKKQDKKKVQTAVIVPARCAPAIENDDDPMEHEVCLKFGQVWLEKIMHLVFEKG
jgi:hypothetical protein